MTLKENVIREAGKYRINVYIKQIWKDSLPTASNTARPSTKVSGPGSDLCV